MVGINEGFMFRLIFDKVEIVFEYFDKFYVGIFEYLLWFEVCFDGSGVVIVL